MTIRIIGRVEVGGRDYIQDDRRRQAAKAFDVCFSRYAVKEAINLSGQKGVGRAQVVVTARK